MTKLVQRGDYERVVFAEVLVPNVLNSFGDLYTEEAIKEFAYAYAKQGYGIDVQHDNVDVSGPVYVIESFIARDGDPDFIKGSWVVGMKIEDDDIWAQVLDGQINGFSYEALVNMTPVVVTANRGVQVSGVTSPHPVDGHTHTYVLVLDEYNKPAAGGTSLDNGHSHTIQSHTVTEVSSGHNHRIQVILPETTEEES